MATHRQKERLGPLRTQCIALRSGGCDLTEDVGRAGGREAILATPPDDLGEKQ
jgi:hypothetical protein